MTVTGEPVPVLESVTVYEAGATQFAVARNGTAVYLASTYLGGGERELVILGADGSEQVLPIDAGELFHPRYSPDGVRIAYIAEEGLLFVFSTLTGTNVPVSGDYPAFFPIWSADGSTITFSVWRGDTENIDGARAPADGSSAPELLYTRPYTNFPQGWLDDGRFLVADYHPTRGGDLLIYRFEGDSVVVTPYLTADWNEQAASISPNGNWVAYLSDESGRNEVYVRAFPQASEKIPISLEGGTDARWSPDGRPSSREMTPSSSRPYTNTTSTPTVTASLPSGARRSSVSARI